MNKLSLPMMLFWKFICGGSVVQAICLNTWNAAEVADVSFVQSAYQTDVAALEEFRDECQDTYEKHASAVKLNRCFIAGPALLFIIWFIAFCTKYHHGLIADGNEPGIKVLSVCGVVGLGTTAIGVLISYCRGLFKHEGGCGRSVAEFVIQMTYWGIFAFGIIMFWSLLGDEGFVINGPNKQSLKTQDLQLSDGDGHILEYFTISLAPCVCIAFLAAILEPFCCKQIIPIHISDVEDPTESIGNAFLYVGGAVYNCFYKGFCCAGICQNKRYVPDDAPKSAQCGLFCGDCAPCRALCRCISGRNQSDLENQGRDEHLVAPGAQIDGANASVAAPVYATTVDDCRVQPGPVQLDPSLRVVQADDGKVWIIPSKA